VKLSAEYWWQTWQKLLAEANPSEPPSVDPEVAMLAKVLRLATRQEQKANLVRVRGAWKRWRK
jgi:hypothetical protein